MIVSRDEVRRLIARLQRRAALDLEVARSAGGSAERVTDLLRDLHNLEQAETHAQLMGPDGSCDVPDELLAGEWWSLEG